MAYLKTAKTLPIMIEEQTNRESGTRDKFRQVDDSLWRYNAGYLIVLLLCTLFSLSSDNLASQLLSHLPLLIQVLVLGTSFSILHKTMQNLQTASKVQFEPKRKLMNRFVGLAIVNLALTTFAQVVTYWTKSLNLSTNELEEFYKAWILPVKAWSFSYTIGMLYAFMTVYLLYRAVRSTDANS